MSPPQDSIALEPPLAFKSQPAGARLNLNPLGRGQGGDYARFASLRSALHALLRPTPPTPGLVDSCPVLLRLGSPDSRALCASAPRGGRGRWPGAYTSEAKAPGRLPRPPHTGAYSPTSAGRGAT